MDIIGFQLFEQQIIAYKKGIDGIGVDLGSGLTFNFLPKAIAPCANPFKGAETAGSAGKWQRKVRPSKIGFFRGLHWVINGSLMGYSLERGEFRINDLSGSERGLEFRFVIQKRLFCILGSIYFIYYPICKTTCFLCHIICVGTLTLWHFPFCKRAQATIESAKVPTL